jgi:hypothetical protein
MDPGIENIVDIGLVNYVKHPTNPDYVVFRFVDKRRADAFEKELKNRKIWFEKGEEQGRSKYYYLYGIHHRDYNKAQEINFRVEGEYRNFIIKNAFLRWFLVLFFIAISAFAIIGYMTRPDVIEKNYIQQKFEDSIRKIQEN